mmetsp:Transcript_10739/g.15973  ORF Transcript_10739/g.15973 Transcript_10739/m.15973 type:complete len:216 (+) Transcript_10739:77-724(+)
MNRMKKSKRTHMLISLSQMSVGFIVYQLQLQTVIQILHSRPLPDNTMTAHNQTAKVPSISSQIRYLIQDLIHLPTMIKFIPLLRQTLDANHQPLHQSRQISHILNPTGKLGAAHLNQLMLLIVSTTLARHLNKQFPLHFIAKGYVLQLQQQRDLVFSRVYKWRQIQMGKVVGLEAECVSSDPTFQIFGFWHDWIIVLEARCGPAFGYVVKEWGQG